MMGRVGTEDFMDNPVTEIMNIIELETIGPDVFRGYTPDMGWKRVFGGQVVSQALAAALKTVDAARNVHSLHGYFLRPGDPKLPIDYSVDRFRDGTSFTTRGVLARQASEIIFNMSSSFHRHETGFEHEIAMPKVPPAVQLPDEKTLLKTFGEVMPPAMRQFFERRWPVELRPVDFGDFVHPGSDKTPRNVWFRSLTPLPDAPAFHQSVLAYASDLTLIGAALAPHGRTMFDPSLMMASLDHAIWFHRPFRADEWLLYSQESPWAGGARGFNRGLIFTTDGRLVASVSQEGLMRLKTHGR